MVRAESASRIARPAVTVFDFVVVRFFENYPRWSPEVRHLEPLGPRRLELGTRARQVRVDQGRRSETTVCVTALEPNRCVRFDSERSPRFSLHYAFAPVDESACHLTFEFRLERLEFFMRPFEKLIRLAIQDGTDRTVRNIKGLIESEC